MDVGIDLDLTAARIGSDVALLSRPPYSEREEVVRRWSFTASYAAADAWLEERLLELGFVVEHDGVGSLIARNRPAGVPAFGLGSHLDSNRNGGPWDGTLGVVCALEIARLDRDHGLGLPLRIFAFAEEEGSGFGEVMLGSRVMLGDLNADDLRNSVRDRAGIAFATRAEGAGLVPGSVAESGRHLDDLLGWIEIHIEQGRQLEAAGVTLGSVTAIAGCLQGDLTFSGRADHAGATPMTLRSDALAAAAAIVVEAEQLAREAGESTVATVGMVHVDPGQRTTIPAAVVLEIDARSVGSSHRELMTALLRRAEASARERGVKVGWTPGIDRPPVLLDERLRSELDEAAAGRVSMMSMTSGAVHDTVLLAARVPSALVFIPCVDGRSHTPEERADPADAASAVDVVLRALRRTVKTPR